MVKLLLSTLNVLLISVFAFGQNIELKGRISESQLNLDVVDCKLTNLQTGEEIFTDDDGNYSMQLNSRNDVIKISHPLYGVQEWSPRFAACTTCNFTLFRNNTMLVSLKDETTGTPINGGYILNEGSNLVYESNQDGWAYVDAKYSNGKIAAESIYHQFTVAEFELNSDSITILLALEDGASMPVYQTIVEETLVKPSIAKTIEPGLNEKQEVSEQQVLQVLEERFAFDKVEKLVLLKEGVPADKDMSKYAEAIKMPIQTNGIPHSMKQSR